MTAYHFLNCGLDNVFVEGIDVEKSPDGAESIVVPKAKSLNRAIAAELVDKNGKLEGCEIRYLRTLIDESQKAFGTLVDRDNVTVSRWERDESAIDAPVEACLRFIVAERLGIQLRVSMETLVARCREKRKFEIRLRFVDGRYEVCDPSKEDRSRQNRAAA